MRDLKYFGIAVGLTLFLSLVNSIGILIDNKAKVELELQSQIEKASDLEMVMDDRLIKDYLRSDISTSSTCASNSAN